MAEDTNLVEMNNISISFGGIKALKNVHFNLKHGEVHALMGENGAGKSTLIKILSGAYKADEGEIILDGEKVHITSPKNGHDQGISVIYQEFALAKDLTVAENIFIDRLKTDSKGAFINWKAIRKDARKLLDELGFKNINENAKVDTLSVAHQQVVEICKSLSRKTRVLVLDEPTAVLASSDVEQLFRLVNDLKKQGVGIIYVSHRLEEIFRISDRITVFKDGAYVNTVNTREIDEKRLVNMMIGRDLSSYFPERNATIGNIAFEVKNITNGNAAVDVSFGVKAGEVLGLSGLVGAGRTETAKAIFGADKKTSGKVYLYGKEIDTSTPKKSIENGIAYLSEDRKKLGILLELSLRINMTMPSIKRYTKKAGFIDQAAERIKANELIETLKIKTAGAEAPVGSLSGGNQQKVVFAKWIASDPTVLILDEPTRGVDVGAKIEIYKVINRLAENGMCIIMISSEMPEIIGMCDRVIVMKDAHVAGELIGDEITETNLIGLSMGVS